MTAPADHRDRPNGRPRWLSPAVVLSAPIVTLTGMQLILPILPVMQRDLGLSDQQISLVSSLYLLPGVFLAIPAGMVGDRFGRRRLFGWSLTVFGLGALLLYFRHDLRTVLAVRVVQGAAFAAVLPLTITLIGEVWRGRSQLQVQGRRVVGMNLANAAWPAVGGLVASVSWQGAFLVQALALPVGQLALRILPPDPPRARQKAALSRGLLKTLRTRPSLAVQGSGLVRFIVRFGFLTYAPILLVGARGYSPVVVGFLLGASAVAATVAAALAGRVALRVDPSKMLALGAACASAGVALLAIGGVGSWVGPLLFGLGDGTTNVVHAGFMTEVPVPDQRASFVAATAATKNLGKFLAPSLVALMLGSLSLPVTLLCLAGLGLFVVPMPSALRGLDGAVSGSPVHVD